MRVKTPHASNTDRRSRNVCPHCNTTQISKRTRKAGYKCSNCKEVFTTPIKRFVKYATKPIAVMAGI